MGDTKLCLLLLLSTSALAYAQDDDQPTCLLAKRYKTLHRYEYRYKAESLNAIDGTSPMKNGPKATCTVEIEVPQMCSFIVHTTGCSLSQVVNTDAAGNPVFAPAPTSNDFAAEMERYPLKFVVEGKYDVKLYPEDGESTTILNVKRGIISALAVPLVEEDMNKKMPTIHGKCRTYSTVNSREDIATDITLDRDLSRCDQFMPIRDHTSPLALVSRMHYPLAQMIRSSQTCNYKFDNVKKHMTSGSCTEKHILVPFSYKGEYGVTNIGKQELTLVQVSPHNDRVFERSGIMKGLHMEAVEDKSAIQDKDAALVLLRELATLPETLGEKRAHLFRRLVTMVRGMRAETLKPAVPEALAVSRVLTYQVLAQCGTPECSSAIMDIFRTFDRSALEVDAGVFAMGLVSNPSPLLINDMLQMAKFKRSKSIMYALSNVVKRFYKAEEKMIPEIFAVAEFMAAQLGDCSADMENTFLTLRVIGNMAPAMMSAGPVLRSAVIRCVNQPAASQEVQQAAVQVFRLVSVPHEGREVLMRVLMDSSSPMQKRIAAYLVLMKDPKPTELAQLATFLPQEQNLQVKSFVESHIANILSSKSPETEELRQMIRDVLQGNDIGPIMDASRFSRNYQMGSLEGNVLFEGNSYLPKEAMLEMTLRAFGYDLDMMEIGMEGKGFEPTVDALFGTNGFFPDTVMKTMYFVSDNMPVTIRTTMERIIPALRRDRRVTPTANTLMRDLRRNVNKLVQELKNAESPEATVYLRLLGNELGYLKTKEVEDMVYSATMMFDSMAKMFPTDLLVAMMSRTDNTMFAHYIFMDNEFFLPTVTGLPLRVALSGTFTPGIKGGLKFARDMSEVAFMPSAGVEFVTQIGVNLPEFVNSGLEMHTNMFHESGLTAKVSMGPDSVKLTIPAPTSPTKLIKITNNLVAVTGSEMVSIPSMVTDKVDVSECTPVFAGMKYCSALQYADAFSQEFAPFFPFTGDSKFAVELHPTGEVSEYTATLAYELLREGEEGRQKVDSVKFVLRAEGTQPSEARAIVKYNRRRNVITADVQIPDYDVEAGIRVGVVDGNTKGKGTHSISLDFVNKNIPQLSVVGRANLKAMREGMMQLQLLVPFLNTDATFTANMKRDAELEMELKSDIRVMAAISEQKFKVKYDAMKMEVEFKSNVNTETGSMPYYDLAEQYGNEMLDMKVGNTDMKVRHIFKKLVEAANNYMETYGEEIPYIQSFRMPAMPEISLPETLFLNTEAKAVYYFNNQRFTVSVPVPYIGGKSFRQMQLPAVLTTPRVSLPSIGLEMVSMEVPIPDLVMPEGFTMSFPLFGKAEFATLMKSNLYNMEASMAAGKEETGRYSAKFDVKGISPIDILSMNMEGSGMLDVTESMKAVMNSSFVHKFFEARVNIVEDATVTDKLNLKSNSKIEASSPMGFNLVLEHIGTTGLNREEISAESTFNGMVTAGPLYGKTISTQSFIVIPFRPEVKFDSSVQVDSTIFQGKNTIATSLTTDAFSLVSTTNAFDDHLTHVVDFSIRDSRLALKCESNAFALGMKIRNQVDASAGAGAIMMRVETNSEHSENRVTSLFTATFDANGLVVSSDAMMRLIENEATHKATLKFNQDGLTTSGTTTVQSPLVLENTFSAGIDTSRATLSVTNKAATSGMKFDNTNNMFVTLSTFDFNSNVEAVAGSVASYTHDITVAMKPYTATANVVNNLNVLMAKVMNDVTLQVEPYKMDLTGNMKAVVGDEEFKHTYQVNYADMTANAKCSTTGRLFGTHMSHNTEVEIFGFAAKITNDARFNSQPVRFDHTIRCSIVPFDFNLDAIFNADGDMILFGKHSGQLYGKWLLRAQPLAFTSTHECRASITQQLSDGYLIETIYDNKMDNVLSPQEQKSNLRMRFKVNDFDFNQVFSAYNTEERAGVELSSSFFTSLFDVDTRERQEFTLSGFVKYDKNTDSRIIQFPFMENLPVIVESLKNIIVSFTETLQNFINDEDMRAKLEAFPQYVSEFMSQVNFEKYFTQAKLFFTDVTNFTPNFDISMEDVEASLERLHMFMKKMLKNLSDVIDTCGQTVNNVIFSGTQPLVEQLININEALNIKATILYVIDAIRDGIQAIDFSQLEGTRFVFMKDFDISYIKRELDVAMRDLKRAVESFDLEVFVDDLKDFCQSVYGSLVDVIVYRIPTYEFGMIKRFVVETIQEKNILEMLSATTAKMTELIGKFEIDKKIAFILENVMALMRQFRMEETFRTVVTMAKNVELQLMPIFQRALDYLQTTEMKDLIQDLNVSMDDVIKSVKAMDYNEFVDYANQIVGTYTAYVNDLIRTLEIPQKLEATREFVNIVLSSMQNVVERIREIRVRDIFVTLKDMNEQLIRPNLHSFVEVVKQMILDFDIRSGIEDFVHFVSSFHRLFIDMIAEVLTNIVHYIEVMFPNQKITVEMRQMTTTFKTQFKAPELIIPSFTVPLTDLVVPSSRTKVRDARIPAQFDIPEFTIMGVHTVQATTVSAYDIKQKIIQYIDLFVNTEIQMFDPEVFFGELTMSFLPPMPDITLPDITFPEISVPTIPQIPVDKLVESLQIPDFKLPSLPTELMVPCFGKLYGEIKLLTPIYTVKTSAEFQNSTESEMTPTFTAFLTSQGTSQRFDILNYKLESMSRIAVPKMSRVVFSETMKFTHNALGVEHQASVSLYGLSAQSQAKTGIKVMTSFYTANFMNIAFIAFEEGMSASLETTYTHLINLPVRDIRNELTLAQKAVLRQDGLTVSLSADNSANSNFNGHNGNHKSNMQLSLTPRKSTIVFTGDTDFVLLKMKQKFDGELQIPVYVKFNVRNEAEAPFIKNSVFVATGQANLYDMQTEVRVNHDTELVGAVSGTVSNGLNFLVRPFEVVFEFQNKGNNKVVLTEILVAKIDLQNDYSAILRPGSQLLNTVALARINQHRMFYNFTVDNNPTEAGFIVSMESVSDLGFLNTPITIPEFDLPFVDFRSPAIRNVNLYEQMGLMNILTTTEQTVNMDAKVIYQKNQGDRFVDILGMMQMPLMGNVISELAFKSAIINLNVNAGLFAEDNLVMRLRATTASVFESLRAKLDGTTSLSTKTGIKLANSMSLENIHIGGTHDSTYSVILETLETTVSVATVAKVALPVLTLEANQNLLADTKTKANAVSTFNFKGNLNVPLFNTIGKANGDYTLKMEGTFDDVSMESSFRTTMDGSVFEDYTVLGFLDNDLNVYINNNGLRSTGKFIAVGKLNNGATKILSMEVNENRAVEVSLSRVYALLKYTGMNEANIFNFNTTGKQVAMAAVDLSMTSPMTVAIEIDLSQPTSMGDFSMYVKNDAGVTAAEQKMSTILKFGSPFYTTNVAADVEGKAPVFKVTMKSFANSAFPVLNYDMIASSIANFENGGLDMNNKVTLTHRDFNMDASHMLTRALRSKRQADNSYHTLNVDLTSPTFTDMNLRYAARRDGVSASISAPAAGFMGLQFNTRLPYQMRVYGRYPSAPEVDIDMLVIRSLLKDDDKMNVQISYNMEVPRAVLSELQTKRALIFSKVSMLADKYQITRRMEALKTVVANRINEAYQAVINYDASMSQLSIFFRNIIVQSQKTIQVFLDAFIRVLRETQFKVPGSDEMTTLPVVLHRLTSTFAAALETTIQKIFENTEVYYNMMVEKLSRVELSMPVGDIVSLNQFFDQVKMLVKKVVDEVVDFVKNMESIDTMVLKIGETLEAVVEKSQEFVDIVRSDYMDAVFVHFNVFYSDFITMARDAADMITNMNMDDISNTFDYVIGRFMLVVEQFNGVVYGFLGQVSDEVQAYIRVNNGMLEIDLPLTFQQ